LALLRLFTDWSLLLPFPLPNQVVAVVVVVKMGRLLNRLKKRHEQAKELQRALFSEDDFEAQKPRALQVRLICLPRGGIVLYSQCG
jgi:hypothetical protein